MKVVSGRSGYDIDNLKLIHNESRIVEAEEVESLLKTFDEGAEFWRLPSYIDDDGFDGASWLIEARSKGRYRHVSRWSPRSGVIWETGLKFLAISGLKIERIY